MAANPLVPISLVQTPCEPGAVYHGGQLQQGAAGQGQRAR